MAQAEPLYGVWVMGFRNEDEDDEATECHQGAVPERRIATEILKFKKLDPRRLFRSPVSVEIQLVDERAPPPPRISAATLEKARLAAVALGCEEDEDGDVIFVDPAIRPLPAQ